LWVGFERTIECFPLKAQTDSLQAIHGKFSDLRSIAITNDNKLLIAHVGNKVLIYDLEQEEVEIYNTLYDVSAMFLTSDSNQILTWSYGGNSMLVVSLDDSSDQFDHDPLSFSVKPDKVLDAGRAKGVFFAFVSLKKDVVMHIWRDLDYWVCSSADTVV
jgi:hypothetical protein